MVIIFPCFYLFISIELNQGALLESLVHLNQNKISVMEVGKLYALSKRLGIILNSSVVEWHVTYPGAVAQ